MPLQIGGILFDELAADPGAPVEGQMWYNTTTDQIKIYRNGAIISLVDRAVHDAHALDVSTNPHSIDLDAAATAGNTLTQDINMGGNNITNLGATGAQYDAASEQWVTDQINAKLRGLDWQESVLDKDLATPPGAPSTGDRYIVAAGGTGAWTGKDGQIAEWDGSAWVFSPPDEGFCTRVEDEDVLYIHDGATWGPFGNAVDHGNLLGLGDDDHTQYLLVSGARAMSGDLDMGGNDVTNVTLVDGVDVSAHASRHIDGGADVIDADKDEISWTGYSFYTPTTSPAEVDALDQLTAHLAGIDAALGGVGTGGAYKFSISPSEMLTSGTSHKVEANDYTAIEFSSNKTDFASYSLFLRRSPASNVLVRVKFVLKQSGSGSNVRIAAKVKARATGEDSSTAFDDSQVQAVAVTTTTIGEIFQAQLSFSSALFADGDAVALHVGRDGAEVIGGGSADDFSKPIQMIAVELEVP